MTSKHFKIVLMLFLCSGVLSPLPIVVLKQDEINASVEFFGAYFPGLIFGAVFGLANKWKAGAILAFTLISGVAYFAAVQSATRSFEHIGQYAAGALAGTIGAVLLVIASKLLTKKQLKPADDVISALVGGLAGTVFLPLYVRSVGGFSSDSPSVQVSLLYQIPAYVLWQVIVGARIYLANEGAPERTQKAKKTHQT